MIPHKTFLKDGMFTIVNGYVFHIGLAICRLRCSRRIFCS